MSDLFIYLAKANLSVILVLLAYHLLLGKLTFYKINRYFLISGILCALILPSLKLRGVIELRSKKNEAVSMHVLESKYASPLNLQILQVNPDTELSIIARFAFGRPAECIIYIGIGMMSFRFLLQLFSLYIIHRRSVLTHRDGFKYRALKDKINPFSFWKTVYIHHEIYSKEELSAIMAHENVHVMQMHTVDVLFAELTAIILWYNPAAWLIKGCIKDNLEFITDQQLISEGADPKQYQYSLLQVCHLRQSTSIVNNFNFLTLKKRIAMMNRKQSNTTQLLRYALVMPFLIVAPFIISKAKAQQSVVAAPVSKRYTARPSSRVLPAPALAKKKAKSTIINSKGARIAPTLITPINRIEDQKISPTKALPAKGIILTSASAQSHENFSPGHPWHGWPDVSAGMPVIVIDGKESTWQDLQVLTAQNIISMTVLKSPTTIPYIKDMRKYGMIMVNTNLNARINITADSTWVTP
jgi:hypothetical protein